MWSHVDSMTRLELRRTHVIEENEWAHHLASRGGQYSTHNETAKVALPRIH
jgi:hypothetical protein